METPNLYSVLMTFWWRRNKVLVLIMVLVHGLNAFCFIRALENDGTEPCDFMDNGSLYGSCDIYISMRCAYSLLAYLQCILTI